MDRQQSAGVFRWRRVAEVVEIAVEQSSGHHQTATQREWIIPHIICFSYLSFMFGHWQHLATHLLSTLFVARFDPAGHKRLSLASGTEGMRKCKIRMCELMTAGVVLSRLIATKHKLKFVLGGKLDAFCHFCRRLAMPNTVAEQAFSMLMIAEHWMRQNLLDSSLHSSMAWELHLGYGTKTTSCQRPKVFRLQDLQQENLSTSRSKDANKGHRY